MKALPENVVDWVVLIVDDHPDNLAVARTALTFYGAKVFTAEDGQKGLEALEQVQPNLILLDLSMPVMDGWTMFEKVRSSTHWAAVPIIALTAHAMQGDRERVLAAGFEGYISKPFDVVSFVSDIQSILSNGGNHHHA